MLWHTDLCLNPGYAQFCPNACADRHSISGRPTPAQGVRGPIDSGSQSGTTPGSAPQSTPVTVPDNSPGVSPETSPGTTQQFVPVTIPNISPGTSEQQSIPAEQLGIPGPVLTQPGGSSQPGGQSTPGRRRRPYSRPNRESGDRTPETGPTSGSGTTSGTGPTPGSGPTPESNQITTPEEGSTLNVWPTEKQEYNPQSPDSSKTPSVNSPSGQTLQIPTIPTGNDPVPDPKFFNNIDQPNAETKPGGSQLNPIPTPNNLSGKQSRYTPPQLAFANIGDQDGGASQDVSPFPYVDTSKT